MPAHRVPALRPWAAAALAVAIGWSPPTETRAAGSAIPPLLVVQPLNGQCSWREYSGPDTFKDLATTESCPTDIWWPVGSRSKVIALGPDRVWTGSLRSLKWTALPQDDLPTLWVVDGRPVVGTIQPGDPAVLQSWHLDGGHFVAGPSRPLTELERIRGGTLLQPPSGKLDSAWTSMSRAIAGAPSKRGILDGTTPQQRALVGADAQEDTVGMLKVGNKHIAYKGIIGDTAHPAPPLVWCRDDTCAQGTPIKGNLPGQLAMTPRDGFLLVTEEYTGRSPRVYAAGGTAPVLTLPDDARAIWR